MASDQVQERTPELALRLSRFTSTGDSQITCSNSGLIPLHYAFLVLPSLRWFVQMSCQAVCKVQAIEICVTSVSLKTGDSKATAHLNALCLL